MWEKQVEGGYIRRKSVQYGMSWKEDQVGFLTKEDLTDCFNRSAIGLHCVGSQLTMPHAKILLSSIPAPSLAPIKTCRPSRRPLSYARLP